MVGYGTKQEIHDAIVVAVKFWREQLAASSPNDRYANSQLLEQDCMSDILMLSSNINREWDGTSAPTATPEIKAYMLATHVVPWIGLGKDPRWMDRDGVEYSWRELGFEGYRFGD